MKSDPNKLDKEGQVRLITYSRWLDMIEQQKSDIEYMPEEDVKEFDNDRNDVFEDGFDEDDENDEQPVPVIVTPAGVIPLKAYNNPTKAFNFWIGETNFTITTELVHILNDVPGIEILDILTRYRFRFAVGNNFKFQEVRLDIQKALNAISRQEAKVEVVDQLECSENMELDPDTQVKVKEIIRLQLSKFPRWALYVCPNGQIDMASSQDETDTKDFSDKVAVYRSAKQMAGGAVFTHEIPPK